jgi:hypothetical protein
VRIDELEVVACAAMAAGNWVEAAQVEIMMDEIEQHLAVQPEVPLVNAALWYAEQGLRVFPLRPYRKEPATPNGFKDATTDPDIIRAWWFNGFANIGIATGHIVDVIDVDPPGVELWAKWLDEAMLGRRVLPEILGSASTVRPGCTHYYIAATGIGCEPGDPNSNHPGIDFKGLGGYVVAPPSVVDGVRYRWRRPLQLPAQEERNG